MRKVNRITIETIQADITALDVDVIVNAANENLAHGGGVAAAISRAGGPAIQEESDRWVEEKGPVGIGEAAVTTAGEMKARHVVHVVGPRYSGSDNDETDLRSAVSAALDAAKGLGARSVAFPAISAGVFGYPRDEATSVIVDEATRWALDDDGQMERIVLVGFDEGTVESFSAALGSG